MRLRQAHLPQAQTIAGAGPPSCQKRPAGKVDLIVCCAAAEKGVDAMAGVVIQEICGCQHEETKPYHRAQALHRHSREQDHHHPYSGEEHEFAEIRLHHEQHPDKTGEAGRNPQDRQVRIPHAPGQYPGQHDREGRLEKFRWLELHTDAYPAPCPVNFHPNKRYEKEQPEHRCTENHTETARILPAQQGCAEHDAKRDRLPREVAIEEIQRIERFG